MMDFLNRLKEYLEGLPFTPSVIRIGTFDENTDSIALRLSPGSINDRDLESGKVYNFSFQILVHKKNHLVAYETIMKIMNELDNIDKSKINTDESKYYLILIECTTTPNYVQKTNYGELYTAIFNAELYVKKEVWINGVWINE